MLSLAMLKVNFLKMLRNVYCVYLPLGLLDIHITVSIKRMETIALEFATWDVVVVTLSVRTRQVMEGPADEDTATYIHS